MRVPFIAALVAVAACADPVAPPQSGDPGTPSSPPLTTSQPDAVALLLSVTMFQTPSRGLSPDDPANWVAWRRILLGETAASDFRYLYEHATTPEGRMYGAAGILAADPEAWTRLAADPRWGDVEIRFISGCIGMDPTAPMLLEKLAAPVMREYFRTGRYPVQHLAPVRVRATSSRTPPP